MKSCAKGIGKVIVGISWVRTSCGSGRLIPRVAKARGLEDKYDALNYRDDQFDLSDAALSVSLAMLAVTALTRKRWLLWTSLVFAAFGAAMGLAGLLGLPLHPNWLSKLIS